MKVIAELDDIKNECRFIEETEPIESAISSLSGIHSYPSDLYK